MVESKGNPPPTNNAFLLQALNDLKYITPQSVIEIINQHLIIANPPFKN